MLHMHFGDGHDAERPWLPRQDSPIVAAAAIHAVLRRTFASIPVFSYDAGVVLEPGVLMPLTRCPTLSCRPTSVVLCTEGGAGDGALMVAVGWRGPLSLSIAAVLGSHAT